jgi:hypothetical protein
MSLADNCVAAYATQLISYLACSQPVFPVFAQCFNALVSP